MQLKQVISVPGMGGLHKVVANNKNGFIVESLADGKRTLVNSNQRIMTLMDIAVYTKEGEVPLREIFNRIHQSTGGDLKIDLKGDQKLIRDYFKSLIPDFDEERVYSSDIKKLLNWYLILKDKIDFTKDDEEESAEEGPVVATDHEKSVPKIHESHGPKTENAKKSTARTRKKV